MSGIRLHLKSNCNSVNYHIMNSYELNDRGMEIRNFRWRYFLRNGIVEWFAVDGSVWEHLTEIITNNENKSINK